jgi:hypothetical protein
MKGGVWGFGVSNNGRMFEIQNSRRCLVVEKFAV